MFAHVRVLVHVCVCACVCVCVCVCVLVCVTPEKVIEVLLPDIELPRGNNPFLSFSVCLLCICLLCKAL